MVLCNAVATLSGPHKERDFLECKPEVTDKCYALSFCLHVYLFIYHFEEPFAEWFLILQEEFGVQDRIS